MSNLTFDVVNQSLKLRKAVPIVSDTINYITVKFTFTNDWNGLIKFAHFAKGDTVYDFELIDDEIKASHHITLDAGEWSIYLHGNKVLDGAITERITTSIYTITVLPSGVLNGEPIPIAPPSIGEQILATAENAMRIAQSVWDDADAGEFDGTTVEVGTTTTGEAGTQVAVDGTLDPETNTLMLNFTIPEGSTGSSGVAISETEPTDPDVNVWINPDGEADPIVEAAETLTENQLVCGAGENSLKKIDFPSEESVLTQNASGAPFWTSKTALLEGKETTDNKVTSVSESSTDAQYPSAKAVHTLVNAIGERVATLETAGEEQLTYEMQNQYDTSTVNDSKYLSNSGGLSSSSSYCVTDYIKAEDGDLLQLKKNSTSGSITYGWGFTVYALYDSSKAYISKYTTPSVSGQYTGVGEFTIDSPNCKYIRVAIPIANKNSALVLKRVAIPIVEPEMPLDNIVQSGGYTAVFPRIACCGDSLTYGALEWTSGTYGSINSTLFSYPSHLQKMCGNTVKNFGSSGAMAYEIAPTDGGWENSWNGKATASGWLTAENKCDAYIIALGTNDIGTHGGFDGDVATDIDDATYANNALTSVGGYAKIIQRIKELQPRAKIFCCTIPNSRNMTDSRLAANVKIRAIAEHFNCLIIDLETYYVQAEDVAEYRAKYYSVGHLNCLGYKKFADTICSYIDWHIRQAPENFYDIPAIETDRA